MANDDQKYVFDNLQRILSYTSATQLVYLGFSLTANGASIKSLCDTLGCHYMAALFVSVANTAIQFCLYKAWEHELKIDNEAQSHFRKRFPLLGMFPAMKGKPGQAAELWHQYFFASLSIWIFITGVCAGLLFSSILTKC